MRFKTLKLSSSTGTSRSQLLVFALFFAIIGGYFIYSSFAVGPSVWVSTTGNDSTCVRGDNAKPCKSFDRAYAIAQLGDTVEVAGGDYGDQTLTLKSDKSAVGDLADVVFQPAPSATVTIGELNSGTDVQSPNGAKHVTIKNMSDNNIGSKYCTWGITNGSEDMSIINGDACNVNVFDSKSITINGGDWGACVVGTVPSSYDDPCSNNKIANSQNVTITNTRIHDIVTADAPSHHIECLFIVSGSNITISKNKFYGCGIYDIFIQRYDGKQISNLLIENNWFAQPRSGEYPNFDGYSGSSVAFSPGSQAFSGVNIRNNSFHPSASISLNDDGTGVAYSNFKVTNNILKLENWACGNGVSFANNIYTGTSGCGGTGSKVVAPGYINNANDNSMDYHIGSSSAAKDAGDISNSPSVDFDGQSRPQGSSVDIGADEYGGTVTPPQSTPGDLNGDSSVNITDLAILLAKWNTTDTNADINSDGTVNILDLSILLSNWGKTYTTGGGGGTVQLFVSPSGNDSTCVRGDSSKPCGSLDKARDIAQCGDGVSIAAGTYNADQNLSSPANTCITNPVVFTVASGATANFNDISMDSPGTTLRGINIPNTPGNSDLNSQGYNIDFEKDCDGCGLYDSTIRTFSIWGSDGVTIEGNIIDANGTDSSIEIQDVGNSDGSTNIVVRNNTIKRFFTDFISGSHSEGLNIGGWTNGITVEGNNFTDNGTTSHIFFTYWGTSAYQGADARTTYPRNACVRGNTFGPTHGAYFDINYREEIPYPQANIKIDPAQNASTTNPEFNAIC